MNDQEKDLGGAPPGPRKRTVVIKLSTRERQDPRAILDAIRIALKPEGIQIRVCEKTGKVENPADDIRIQASEQLEAKAMTLAGAVLDKKAREIRQGDSATERVRERAKAVVIVRKWFLSWVAEKARVGWRITVAAVMDWVKEQVK